MPPIGSDALDIAHTRFDVSLAVSHPGFDLQPAQKTHAAQSPDICHGVRTLPAQGEVGGIHVKRRACPAGDGEGPGRVHPIGQGPAVPRIPCGMVRALPAFEMGVGLWFFVHF
jgi:hypothetical protein